jgi:3D (Asp-Asp-Asp) domain-containing protein
MLIAMISFVLLYEVSIFDIGQASPARPVDPTLPAAGARLVFTATAYCKGTTTASGVGVRTGIAASDPAILPVGSVVNLSTHSAKYNGVYTIMDTGPAVQGRVLDLYMWSCHEALAFGRRPVEVSVLRLGWNPSASTASFIDRFFRRSARTESRVVQPQAPAVPDAGAAAAGSVPTAHVDPSIPVGSEALASPAVPISNEATAPVAPATIATP